jgi:hypothetical protein
LKFRLPGRIQTHWVPSISKGEWVTWPTMRTMTQWETNLSISIVWTMLTNISQHLPWKPSSFTYSSSWLSQPGEPNKMQKLDHDLSTWSQHTVYVLCIVFTTNNWWLWLIVIEPNWNWDEEIECKMSSCVWETETHSVWNYKTVQ